MARKILQPFYTIYVVITFLVTVLFIFLFIAVLSPVKHFAARKAIFNIVRHWAFFWLWLIGMSVKVTGRYPVKGRYIIVVNHISYLDTLVIFPAIRGYFRTLGKKEISKIPVIGLIYKQMVILVDRDRHQSKAMSFRYMWRVLKNEGNIVIFPEGTFNETGNPLKDFYDGAFRLAINTKTPVLPLIFPDTVNRWDYSAWWKLWPGRNRAVFLEPVEVAGLTLENLPTLKQKVYGLMENELVKLRASV